MPFQILLQTTLSEKNALDKNINTIATVTGTLRSDTSIVSPIILIDGVLETYAACNYMTIPAFNRGYFVNDITAAVNGLIELDAHVDVLATYKTAIRENSAIIRKQESAWNLYLNDGSLRVYQNPHVITRAFPHGFTTCEFVLAIAGS